MLRYSAAKPPLSGTWEIAAAIRETAFFEKFKNFIEFVPN
jgi:hypothetical protein